MSALRRLLWRVANLFRANGADRAFDRELTSHRTILEDEHRRRGMTPEEARRAAAIELGGIEQTKELHRATRSLPWVETAYRDVIYALRMLRRSPLTSAAAIGCLALGIGLNAAVFSVVDWVLVRPLPFPSPDRLIRVSSSLKPSEVDRFALAKSLEAAAAYSTAVRVLASASTQPVHVVVARVSGDVDATFKAIPAIGRTLRKDEIANGDPIVVLGNQLWERRFGSDPSIIGRTVTLDGKPHSIVGVMRVDQQYPNDAEVWRPTTPDEREDDDRELSMIGRLSPATTIDQASAELGVPAEALQRADVKGIRPALDALQASTLLVLLIVVANVAGLIGATTAARVKEMVVRHALGATKTRLVTQMTIENVVLVGIAGALGLLLGRWALRLLVALAPVGLPRLTEISLDQRIAGAGIGLTLFIGLVVGITPAIHLSRRASEIAIQANWNRSTRRSSSWRGLVLAQTALTVILTIGAGLFGRSLMSLVSIDNGFEVDHLIAADLYLRGTGSDARQVFQTLTEATQSIPGVESVALSMMLPTQVAGLRVPAQIVGGSEKPSPSTLRPIGNGYFETLGVKVKSGRSFDRTDTRTAPAVAIVNATFVRDVLGGQTPLGTRLTIPLVKTPVTVVGVVPDFTPAGAADRPAMYMPMDQVGAGGGFLLVRVHGDPRSMVPVIASRISAVAPKLAVDGVRPAGDVLAQGRAISRFTAQLAAIFAILGLVVSAVGLYGLTSRQVTAQWRELAIRVALGAPRLGVLWTVVGPCVRITLAGAMIGLIGAIATGPRIASLLHGIRPTDPLTLIAAPVMALVVGIAAAILAAVRVVMVTPATTLRGE